MVSLHLGATYFKAINDTTKSAPHRIPLIQSALTIHCPKIKYAYSGRIKVFSALYRQIKTICQMLELYDFQSKQVVKKEIGSYKI